MILTQDQLDSMVQAGNSVGSNRQPLAQPTQSANPPWLQAMLDAAPNANQSSALLGHATSLAERAFQNPLQNIASGNSGDNVQHAIGAGKQALADIASVGAQNAGPVGKAMLANAPGFSQNIESFNQAVKPTNLAQQQGAGETALGEALIPVGASKTAGEALQPFKEARSAVSDFLAKRATSKAVKAVESSAEIMTKSEKEAAIAEGRMEPTLLGGGKYVPSKTEERAGQMLTGKLSSNPVKNVPIVQKEIATRGQEAETYLEQNAKAISNAEDFSAFQAQRAKTETYLTPTATKAYDEMIGVFQKVLKNYAEKDGGYNTSNYYKALKEFESNVTQNLPKGKEALLDEGGSARLQAAKDVRKVVRDMVGEKNPEFKNKMFDLASLYDARDNVISKALNVNKSGIKEFAKKHPFITGAASFGVGEAGLNKVKDWTGL